MQPPKPTQPLGINQPPSPHQPLSPASLPRPTLPKSLPPPQPLAPTSVPARLVQASVPPPRVAPASVPPPRVPPASLPQPRPAPSTIPPANSRGPHSRPHSVEIASTIPPSAPLPSNVSLPGSASLPSNVSRASNASQASNVSPPGPEHYYVRFGNEVRTFPFDEVKRRFQTGEITAETWICKVGDSEWRKIADAHALDLGPPPELQSVTSVYDRQPVIEREGASPSPLKRVWHRAIRQENRLMLAVWILLGTLGLTLILQRSGALYAAFSLIGQEKEYEALETDLLGGPSSGTVRSAEKLWAESISTEKFPFSEVQARDGEAVSDKKTTD